MAANKEIKNWVNDLRITDDCKGAYLTIDDNLNVAWKQGTTETRTGEVWQYNSITQDSYVILPQASVNIGLCVALMRNKTESGTNPKLVILPEKSNGEYDTIQGSKNFYTSAGVSIDSNGKITESQDGDSFSSVIFKAVQMGNNQYGWVIINGVGSWNGETISDTIYEAVKAKYTQQAISVQTAGANTLSTSGGLGSTQAEFVEFTGLKNYPKSVKGGTEVELKPFNSNDSLQYMIIAPARNNYVNYYYTQNITTTASFNIFGKLGTGGLKNKYYSAPKVNTINLNSSINWLGYPFRRTSYTGNVAWCQGNKEKSYTYKLIKNKLVMIFDSVDQINRLGSAQITVPVDLNNFKLSNNKSLTEVNKVYMDLDFGAEQDDDDWKCYHIIAYKVPATWNDASIVDSNNIGKVIPLKFQGDGRTVHSDLYSSNLVGIPLTEEDKTNGKFNLVFEFIADDESGNRTESDFIKYFPYNNVYYAKFRFIGFEQLKQVSISPEVEFEQFGAHGMLSWGKEGKNRVVEDAYLAATIKEESLSDSKIAISFIPNQSYTGFAYKANTSSETYKTFFNQFGSYKPSTDITKTVIKVNMDFPEISEDSKPAQVFSYELVIDWVNRNWQINGFVKANANSFTCVQQGEFSDTAIDLTLSYYSGNNLQTYTLKECLLINGSGIVRLPHWIQGLGTPGKELNAIWNFTHYKTIVNPSGYPVEVLCHYKCGWERAENVWSTNYKADGSEFDGLLEYPNDSSSNGLVSPSKACISPTHYRMKPDAYNVEFTTDRGLLPYYKEFNCYHNSTKRPCYFFNTHYVYSNQAQPNISDYMSGQWLTADAFCTLTFTPQTSGLLKGYIRIPQLALPGTGRLIIKETYNAAKTENPWSDYIMIKDDFNGDAREAQNAAPDTEFSDTVKAYEKIRYTVILYSTVNWLNGNRNDAYVSSVCRSAFPQNWDHWITDFKTLYDKNYISSYSIGTGATGGGSNSSTMRKVFGREPSTTGGGFVNSIANKDGMFIQDKDDAGYFDVNKFAGSFYKDGSKRASDTTDLSQSNSNADTTSANMGSPFEFLVYVMKTA